MTTDMEAAKRFYGKVVGWGTQDMPQPGMQYTLFTVGETPAAGLMNLPDDAKKMGAPPSWIGYGVADVDASAKKAGRLGGSVHVPSRDIPDIGRFAVIADPQGATISLFRGTNPKPPKPAAPGTPGHAGWHELLAADILRRRVTDRRHIQQAGDGAGAVLELLLQRRCHRAGSRARESRRRQDHQRPDGGARRKLDRAGHRSAGRDVLAGGEAQLADTRQAYCATPLPNDQFSLVTSRRLMNTSLGRMPGLSASRSVMHLNSAFFCSAERVLLTVI